MREQLLGSELRDWCQQVGLLEKGEDFADRRSPDTPTVRIARTILVNFYLGKEVQKIEDFHQPVLCKSGGVDDEYMKIRTKIAWSDPNLSEMGKQFARLNKQQRETVTNRNEDSSAEFARKVLSFSVVASWAYAAGLFQQYPDYLKSQYSIPDNSLPPEDPLNAKALSEARLKGVDKDTYRGLGTRSSNKELGRMLEVFLVLATKGKKRVTKDIANAAIQSYEAKRAVHEANKGPGENIAVFEEYLQDAHHFMSIADGLAKDAKDREARRYYRASVFYASGAMEAFVNYIADSFAKAASLTSHETSFLNDKTLVFSAEKGLTERPEFHRLDDKLRLLMRKFVPGFEFQNPAWMKFMQFKVFRDSLVHPREMDDNTPLDEYRNKVHAGLKAIIEIMNVSSKGIFKQPLRRQLLDLIPE
jgi:hypothetical protein